MAHTPGTWRAVANTVSSEIADTGHIAHCHGANKEANARLIATAPEMFGLLCAIHTALMLWRTSGTQTSFATLTVLCDRADEIIAKATGA